ncbi:hypothetical protein Cwoe_5194 [Conexibacter woesei DSM 14684]|uniref:Uncharacterized protein n=1 Tax=Conexibacter woesei (strain DSM 14684 / CCUG 47730 / CIP 108061 / JCM 11494 / NBRC 100937 / ID131577) TaxID=469383 RepID=D3FEB0_CONWI|nr:hypothetical protein Cwoe_5194 [Conexibacter woesei DSM 14684]
MSLPVAPPKRGHYRARHTGPGMGRTIKKAIGALVVLALLATSVSAGAVARCEGRAVADGSSRYKIRMLAANAGCADAFAVADAWYEMRSTIPRRVMVGGGDERGRSYGYATRVAGHACRIAWIGTGVIQVRCATLRRLALWTEAVDPGGLRVEDIPYPQLGGTRPPTVPERTRILPQAPIRAAIRTYGAECVRFTTRMSLSDEDWAAVLILPAESWCSVQPDVTTVRRDGPGWRRHQYGNGGGCGVPRRVREDLRLACY